ncbi:unnamed protein product [Bursaphelenchus okinawaensis]|uniref:AMP-binding domain-containing protein n=1 Tax=Bursaphelenchus okinawaensis TaxID=465554 RepID=A0A811KQS2_9BILA|nr:unnamed protein product [Bursaphelenchus okinawaensis]CAG9109328.1 unnamed protein product [Bursaphelenchus okinawaensis]
MLRQRLPVLTTKRFNGNFVKAAGFDEKTKEAEFGSRKLLIQDEKNLLTYDGLNQRVGQYANLLSTKYGLTKGDRLLSRTSKTTDTVALYLATLRIGAIYIPLNPDYTTKETNHFVNDGEPKVLVSCEAENDKVFEEKGAKVVDEKELGRQANSVKPALEVENVSPDDVATILYTSGTTGLPKGAMLTHRCLQANGEALADLWRFTKGDVLLHQLPFYHIHGMCITFSTTLMSKSSTIFRPKFDVDDACHYMPKSSIYVGVPTYYTRLMADTKKFNKEVFKNVRVFIAGSAPLTPATWEGFKQHTGHPILERYGMSETLASISNPYEEDKRIPGSVGVPVPGMSVRLGKNDVIEVKGPSVFKGYWKLPEKTKSEFTEDGYFMTGDVGQIDENGYYKIMAREKDMVISGGFNVYPKELEDTIDTLELVKEAAIIGVPHPDFGEGVVAVCRALPGTNNDETAKKLKAELKTKLANYKRPKKYVFVDDYPRNFIGKVQKNKLREQYKDLFA